jgi:hypothetical protein
MPEERVERRLAAILCADVAGFSIAEFCAANDPTPEIAAPMAVALRAAGLPE